MKAIIVGVLCLCLLHTHLVYSGSIFDKITSGFTQVRQKVSCGAHKIGNTILSHEHHHNDPCDNNDSQNTSEKTNVINTGEVAVVTDQFNNGTNAASDSSTVQATTEKTATNYATVPNGKRIIAVGANCPAGQRGDGTGACREEY